MNPRQHLLAIDVETGGFLVGHHALLAIAAVPNWDQEPFYVKVRPGRAMWLDRAAVSVNGYTEEGWKDAVRLDVAMAEFEAWLRARPAEIEEVSPLAHNAGFDRAWIEWAEDYARVMLEPLRRPWRCSMAVLMFLQDMGLCTQRYGEERSGCSLDALCVVSGQERLGPHDALVDARCTLRGYVWMAEQVAGAVNEPLRMSVN